MSILDIEYLYPNDQYWIDLGFINIDSRRLWITSCDPILHWNISDTGTSYGRIRIYIEYHDDSKLLRIIQHPASDYYNKVYFKPIELYNPTSQEIKMVLNKKYFSSRLIYKK